MTLGKGLDSLALALVICACLWSFTTCAVNGIKQDPCGEVAK